MPGPWVDGTTVIMGADATRWDAGLLPPINAQTGTTYTLVLTDGGEVVECANAAAITVTVPPNSSVAFPIGTIIEIDQTGAGQVTISPGAGVTINNSSSNTTRVQWSAVRLRKRATNSWSLTGDLT